ncbi:MAG TPA: RodZ domain-containing protein [Candidatus Saccharimonadales bacterium]|nr:RodZ domain-containing protein [Candidatus Saccharimonadales bacterium]
MARGNFGERLKRERELREVTLEEITSATRIGPRFLEALENEEWEKLPGGVFNRGFVRSVARYLGLDEEAFLAEYDLAHGAQAAAVSEKRNDPIPSPPKWIPATLVLAILALIAGLFFGGRYAWRYYQARRTRAAVTSDSVVIPQPPIVSSANATVPPPQTEPTANPANLNLAVSASAPAHLRVLADGNLVFDKDLTTGENRRFTATHDFEVSASDSGAVLLELNGQTVPPLGLPGSSGTIKLSAKDLKQAKSGNSKP